MISDDKVTELFQSLGRVEASLLEIRKVVPLVEKHEQVVKAGQWIIIPALAALHLSFKHLLSRL
jgi:hypothetical protein